MQPPGCLDFALTNRMPATTPNDTPIQPSVEMRMSNRNSDNKMIGTLLNPPMNDNVDPLVREIVQNADAHTAVVRNPDKRNAALKYLVRAASAFNTAGNSPEISDIGIIGTIDNKFE